MTPPHRRQLHLPSLRPAGSSPAAPLHAERWRGEDDGRAGEEADGGDDEARPGRPRRDASRHGPEDGAEVRGGRASCRRSWRQPRTGGRGRTRSPRTGRSSRRGSTDDAGARGEDAVRAACEEHPGRYEPGQLRTLQRRVRQWRAQQGPDQEVFFAQAHRPGEAAQTDFTETSIAGVTIAGEVFVHLLCVFVLPYSNWQWATVCLSESMAALRRGVQAALFQLGRVPAYHQTDNSTAATHRIPDGQEVLVEGRQRPFNDGVPGADAALRDEAADDRGRRPRSRTATSRPATGRSSAGSSRRCSCAGAATSRASRRGRASSTRCCARPTRPRGQGRRGARGDAPLTVDQAAGVHRGDGPGERREHDPRAALRLLGAVAADRRGRPGARLRGPARGPLRRRAAARLRAAARRTAATASTTGT